MHCFPLGGREVLFGRTFLFDADTRHVLTTPDLHKPKKWPLSLFVPSASADDSGGTFFLHHGVSSETGDKMQQQHPSVRGIHLPQYRDIRTVISSYALLEVDGGNQICISVEGAGTYCLHMVNHTWTHLAKANGNLEPTLPWRGSQDSQLVNLGSGRFCIARFFHTRTFQLGFYDDQMAEDDFAVLTCVDVAPCHLHDGNGNSGKVKLQMIKHKSKFHMSYSDSKIMSVF
ncbi:hypothetical protein BRADI_1g52431v3 [Brachypodium distachyon]|uniref:Uncharacterized protein n=1 Tax=Brachypodium distachyon TaxID=15368 RepID=A0A0Q3NRH3_BRADI|nr:hypothetical protein BRADI_1g52431v3 [Brachypodium distachyon]